jgi:hypothetical protein
MSVHGSYFAGKNEDLRINLVLKSFDILLICDWLNMQELGNLDMAISDHNARKLWLNILEADGSQAAGSTVIRRLGG